MARKQYQLEYTVPKTILVEDDDKGRTWTVELHECGNCGENKICFVWEPQDCDDCYSFFCKKCLKEMDFDF